MKSRSSVETPAPQHEETIVPVRPGGRTSSDTATRAQPASRRGSNWIAPATIAVVAATLLFGAFVAVPRWFDRSRRAAESAAQAAPAAPVAPVAPRLSAQEPAALKTRGESLLTTLLTQQSRVTAQRAESWGADRWASYQELSDSADDAFLAEDYKSAVDRYTAALAIGEELLGRSSEIVERALAAARGAFAAGNSAVALDQYDIVLGIDPEHEIAKRERARAQRLPEVLTLVQRGDGQRAAGELEAAVASYRAALAIDGAWEPARSSLTAVDAAIRNAQFERSMSLGFSALAEEQFAKAEENFRAALAMRPQAREAQEGLTQAQQGAKLDKIALTEARALAFERRELWDEAIAQYEAALQMDATLEFAQTGLERARGRAGLDAKLRNLIDNPRLLFGDKVLADSRTLIDEGQALTERGPRLEEQIAQLNRLVALASTPIPVELRSDQLTIVTLYRVGALGAFATKQVELKPGTYTAIGSRDGYRDVRQTFTVVPGRAPQPVSVICVEQI